MRNNNVLKFALIASLVLNVTVLATAGYRAYQHPAPWVSPMGVVMKPHQFLFEELSLKPEQIKALKEQTIPFRAEIDRRRQEIVAERKKLFMLMRSDEPDRKAVDTAISRISRMQEDMQRRITSHMLEVKASLDQDNQRKFIELIESKMTAGVQAGCPPDGQDR
jgi:Spy/CpxP family protein refolding chaperone